MKRVLLIAFQYPPMSGTSGVQRALRFSQYLPQFGWQPIVLTVHPMAYERSSDEQMGDIPAGTHVTRALALDTARHLAIGGKYLSALAIPDRWRTWWASGVLAGLGLIRRFRPAALWSTFPIPTAHRIGLTLSRLSGLPWIADFRDVMTEEGYPSEPRLARSWRNIEANTIEHCRIAVFTTPGAARMYADRYRQYPADRFAIIENGFDEQLFARLDVDRDAAPTTPGTGPIRLLHSGVVYPAERDPTQLFAALRELRDRDIVSAQSLRIVLRATGHDRHIGRLRDAAGVADMVELAPPVPYDDALKEMISADGLLLLQANNCNRQIPAKLYEYLRCRRPILGLVDGDTKNALMAARIDTIAPLESKDAIAAALARFLALLRRGEAPLPCRDAVRNHTRQAKTGELANLLAGLSN